MSNINGYCPNCKISFDGELVIDTFRKMYGNEEDALKTSTEFSGYKQHGLENRWSNAISISNWDSHQHYLCKDCNTAFADILKEL